LSGKNINGKMMASKTAITLEEVLKLVKQLKLMDKVRLIE